MSTPIVTARMGDNAPLFADIISLYVPEGALVLDMTYGNGNFWKGNGLPDHYRRVSMDYEKAADVCANFESPPFRAGIFGAVVFDPPYANNGGEHTGEMAEGIQKSYNLKPGLSWKDIQRLYAIGMFEAERLLAGSGILIVKCQDLVEGSKQRRMEHHVSWLADCLHLEDEDTFVLVNPHPPVMRHPYQHHARKNHSYFRVWRKPGIAGQGALL